MDVWGWIAVYAVGLTLLQLLVYRYLLNSGGSLTRRVGTPFGDREGERDSSSPWVEGSSGPAGDSGSSPPSSHGDGTAGRDTPSPRGIDAWPQESAGVRRASETRPTSEAAPTDGRPCRHCGAVNETDTTFSRCWNCAREL
ncbi:DUF7577 domain-containing protein [Salinigranum halophilum]|jgi:hypothetical protein|uniref:DUF7577 domain-containing protein n=1 Tax=Salinigranum halophilum TaxID=2565931 RepID=UPI0010A76540|nr:hypothetical protein [Salinigranum halophilum]